MNVRRLLLAAFCRDGARGPMARRASGDGEFVRALGETDRLLRIAPADPGGPTAGDHHQAERARLRIVRALEGVEPAGAPALRRRPIVSTAFAAAAAAAVVLTPLVVWRTASAPAPAPMAGPGERADEVAVAGFGVGPEAAASPRLSWTLVADFDQPLRAEAAALASDVRRFGAFVAPGVVGTSKDDDRR